MTQRLNADFPVLGLGNFFENFSFLDSVFESFLLHRADLNAGLDMSDNTHIQRAGPHCYIIGKTCCHWGKIYDTESTN